MAPWKVAHGAVWLQMLASLPPLLTHSTFCAWTGVAEIASSIAPSAEQNKASFLMISCFRWMVDGIRSLQRCRSGETSVAAVGAHLVVAEGDQLPRGGLYPDAVAADRRAAH